MYVFKYVGTSKNSAHGSCDASEGKKWREETFTAKKGWIESGTEFWAQGTGNGDGPADSTFPGRACVPVTMNNVSAIVRFYPNSLATLVSSCRIHC